MPEILKQGLEAVAYAHEQGVVHRHQVVGLLQKPAGVDQLRFEDFLQHFRELAPAQVISQFPRRKVADAFQVRFGEIQPSAGLLLSVFLCNRHSLL